MISYTLLHRKVVTVFFQGLQDLTRNPCASDAVGYTYAAYAETWFSYRSLGYFSQFQGGNTRSQEQLEPTLGDKEKRDSVLNSASKDVLIAK